MVQTNTKEIVLPAKSRHLDLVACLYESLGSTSCQTERTFLPGPFLGGDLRTPMTATKAG